MIFIYLFFVLPSILLIFEKITRLDKWQMAVFWFLLTFFSEWTDFWLLFLAAISCLWLYVFLMKISDFLILHVCKYNKFSNFSSHITVGWVAAAHSKKTKCLIKNSHKNENFPHICQFDWHFHRNFEIFISERIFFEMICSAGSIRLTNCNNRYKNRILECLK